MLTQNHICVIGAAADFFLSTTLVPHHDDGFDCHVMNLSRGALFNEGSNILSLFLLRIKYKTSIHGLA
jgi:hypothetical protein